jgi:hypothetical protein
LAGFGPVFSQVQHQPEAVAMEADSERKFRSFPVNKNPTDQWPPIDRFSDQ